jgi:hypothetical protein
MKKFTISHYTLLALSLIYSFKFYNTIAIELAIMAIIFDIIKPTIFISAVESKKTPRIIFSSLVIVLVIFNLLAISSSFINNYNKQSTIKTISNKYTIHNKKLSELNKIVDNIKQELSNYPTLDSTIKDIPGTHSTNRLEITKSWQQGKKEIEDRLNISQSNYSSELSKDISKYQVNKNEMGYSSVFEVLSKNLNVSSKSLILSLYILFAIMLEILIFYTKILSNKELKNYTPSSEEIMAKSVKEMNFKLQQQQLKALEENFNNNIIGIEKVTEKNKFIIPEITVNEVLEDIEIHVEQEEVIENKFLPKPLKIENIREYYNYVIKNSKNDVAIGYKKVAESLGINQSMALRIFNKLRDKEYLVTADRKTLIEKKEFDMSDFEEVQDD